MKLFASYFVVFELLIQVNCEAAVELQPHRAYYTVSLSGRPDPRSDVSDIRGTMMIEFDHDCGGWTVQQLSEIWRYHNDEESTVEHVRWGYVTFENKEGTLFKFNTFRKVNDELVEDISGVARRDGKVIQVHYQKPEKRQVQLPEGTLFPQQHLISLLDAAQNGEQMFPRTVFDGSSVQGASEINTFIGAKKVTPDNAKTPGTQKFASQPYWPIQFAVYGQDKSEYEPEYVTTQDLLSNGIIEEYIIDYGGIKIKGVLERVELLPNSGC